MLSFRGRLNSRSYLSLFHHKNFAGLQSTTLPPLRYGHFEAFPASKGLYDKSLEKDSCGVGLVAHMKKVASREIVLDANQMLVRMSHRGGCGCEVNTGDGAGNRHTALNFEVFMSFNNSQEFYLVCLTAITEK